MNPAFPEEAEPVRQMIRELVKRPKELPKTMGWWSAGGVTRLRWEGEGFCPWFMTPHARRFISHKTNKALGKFFTWWDSCTEAQQAVDTVWGDE